MSILNELAKEDKKWRGIAFNLCKDKMLADDLVQNMYLKLMHLDVNKYLSFDNAQQCNYVKNSIRFLFIDLKRRRTDQWLEEIDFHFKYNDNTFEPDDKQQAILEAFYSLDWVSQELTLESLDKSYREIERVYNINYGYAYREVKKAKQTIRDARTKR
tara:strand:- start:782 stop:1255 length:474 start_codon:yes stop_codon:yes gene_type:complete